MTFKPSLVANRLEWQGGGTTVDPVDRRGGLPFARLVLDAHEPRHL